jgi:hypothetical protein
MLLCRYAECYHAECRGTNTQIPHALILASYPIFHIFSIFMKLSEFHKANLKLPGKQHLKIDLLHLIVAPLLNGGWEHNY